MLTVHHFSTVSCYSIPLTQSSISFYFKCIFKTPHHLLPLFAKFYEQLPLITDKQITYVMDYNVLTMSLNYLPWARIALSVSQLAMG
jgi:hypothetical protein